MLFYYTNKAKREEQPQQAATNKQLTWLALKNCLLCGQNFDESVVSFAWRATLRYAAYTQFLPA